MDFSPFTLLQLLHPTISKHHEVAAKRNHQPPNDQTINRPLAPSPALPIVKNGYVSGCISQGKGGVIRGFVLGLLAAVESETQPTRIPRFFVS